MDERGFIWIGTREGLNCYNGNSIITYKSQKNNPNSLFSNNILKITGNQDGKIYLLCLDGLSEWDMEKERFVTVIESSDMTAVHYNKQLYIGKLNKIYRMRDDRDIEPFFELPQSDDVISAMFIDDKGLIWVGTSNRGLYRINSLTKQVAHLIDKANITDIYEDNDKNIWVGSWEHGLYRFAEDECTRYRHNRLNNSISSDFVRACCQDNQGNIWIGTFAGLDKLNLKTGKFSSYSTAQPNGMTHHSIWSMIKDHQGTMWFGTYFGGVNYFNPDYEIYTRHRSSKTENDGLSSPIVGNMTEDNKGNLWICTEGGGVNVYDRNKRLFKWYRHDKSNGNSISHNNVKAIYYDSENDVMWIGTHLGGLNKLDLKTNRFTHYLSAEDDSTSLPSNIIRDIIPYGDNLILATHNGVCMFSPLTGACRQMFMNTGQGHLVKTVGDLFIDYYGDLWLAVSGEGVFSYNFETGRLVQYKHDLSDSASISNNNINHIYQDHNYNLWFSTSGSGLDLFNYEDKNFTNYDSQRNGIASDCIYKVCESRFGELLLITNQGFSLFDFSNNKFHNYNKDNGFPLSIINENAMYLTNDGEVFLGGVQGMVSFYEKDLRLSKKKYNIVPYRLIVNNKTVLVDDDTGILHTSLSSAPDIILGSKYSVFSVEFGITNYIPSNKDKIVYRLEGFSEDWINTNGQNIVTYTNLNPGKYTLVIKAANEDSGNADETRLNITILPPFYKTGYAYLLYLAATTIILYYTIKSYKRRVELQESLKYEQKHIQDIEELNRSKLRFFTNISHEFRTPLTLIIGQLEATMQIESFTPKVYNKLLSVYKNSLQMKGLITELLDFRKQEQGHMSIKASEHNLIDFLEEIFLLFSGYAAEQGINLVFNKKGDSLKVWFDARQIQKVFSNLLSNAFKYTQPGGTVTIDIGKTDSEARIQVSDTGKGIDPGDIDKIFDRFYQSSAALSGTGIGLALSKGIVEMHKGRITVESEVNKGSRFTIYLKLGKEHFDEGQIAKKESLVLNEEATVFADTEGQLIYSDSGNSLQPKICGAKMLIVEDNAPLQELLVRIFEPFYTIATASDGREGLQKAKQEMPDIVLSDVLMPIMSGVELCREIKSDLDICHIPVVLLTARTTTENAIEGFRNGADDYITKPFDVNLLISRCNGLVNSRVVLHEKFSRQPQMTPWMLATNKLDQAMIDKVVDIVNENIGNPDFSVDQIASEIAMARTNLYSKIKAITGQTPNKFILAIRLKKAALLLRSNPELRISEISDIAGFTSAGYFGKCFKEYFNMTPMTYRAGNKGDDLPVGE